MQISLASPEDPMLRNAADILAGRLEKRAGAGNSAEITLSLSPALAAEEFEIVANGNSATVAGGSGAGVIYGCGRLLRKARFDRASVDFGQIRERQSPDKPIRGMYFATHFYNYYHVAPLDEIAEYIEDLALWGQNTLLLWFDLHHHKSLREFEAQEQLARLKAMHKIAKSVGMKVGLLMVANEAYADSPIELRADLRNFTTFTYGNELCPSKPGGMEMIVENTEQVLSQFDHLDYLGIWPYDQGGCGCDGCRPWGCNGFLKAAEEINNLFRERWPDGRVILSTWLFDYPNNVGQGEWDGLFQRLENGLEWVDVVMADAHWEFPRPPLERKLPRGIPLVSFPEISMLAMPPWGAYGANPYPAQWQKLWDLIGDHISGSFPYSEGIYEDLNKVIWLQKNWNGARAVEDILREYISYEFSSDCIDSIVQALKMMETTAERRHSHDAEPEIVELVHPEKAPAIRQIVAEVDPKLPPQVRKSWRWRILFLRAVIDDELSSSGGRCTPIIQEAFDEIGRIHHVGDGIESFLKPPFR